VLASRPAAGVRVFTIWQPILATDLAPPLSSVLKFRDEYRHHVEQRRCLVGPRSGESKREALTAV